MIGKFLFKFGETFLARGVSFFLERLPLHFELHDLPLKLVDFRWERIELNLEAGGGLIHKVDRLVWQKSVADVAVREGGGSDERSILDAHSVMHFVALFESAENGDSVFEAGLIDHDGLEAALEGGVLLDVLSVFIERGRTDGAQLAAGKLRLEHVRCVGGPFGRTGSDNGMKFVDKEDDLALRRMSPR